jgi:cytochrome c-type biogenesis protein CcmE
VPNTIEDRTQRPRLSGKFVLLGASILSAVVFLIWTGTQSATVYYHTVNEVEAMGSDAYHRLIRVNGTVTDNSIKSSPDHQLLTFSIQDDSGQIPVEFRGLPPDLFGYSSEGRYQEIIVEGQLQPNGVFRARSLIVKHGPDFEPREIPAR